MIDALSPQSGFEDIERRREQQREIEPRSSVGWKQRDVKGMILDIDPGDELIVPMYQRSDEEPRPAFR